ncbi:hypothetical protein LJC36_01440 [Desulfovibrio sp. OttesenSCG-928-C14]|nr:hypothetical protein [Desulfovibrio sp. OttesenSCG-928-C14]
MNAKAKVVGRLAPSPTGLLHLGNAWASLCAWLGARAAGGRLILRIEDIDPQRSRPEYAEALQEDLRWLGLDWDYGPGLPYFQSSRLDFYAAALEYLKGIGLAYPCFCTRKELRDLAGAPHYSNAAADMVEAFYPGICRALSREEREEKIRLGRVPAWRLRFEDFSSPELRRVNDLIQGCLELTPEQAGGDFPLRRSDGVFAYQLAVTLDDLDMGVTQVVRGADILSSTPRQRYLLRLLRGFAAGGPKEGVELGAGPECAATGYAAPGCVAPGCAMPGHVAIGRAQARAAAENQEDSGAESEPGPAPWDPEYAHVPLLLDHRGERLAKRHASLSLRSLREDGASPERVLGFLAFIFGLRERDEAVAAGDLLQSFSFSRIRPEHVLLPEDAPLRLRSGA